MKINNILISSEIRKKIIKGVCWVWLILCFLYWLALAIGHFLQPIEGKFYYFLSLVFDSKLGIFLLCSPLLILIVLIKLSMARQKVTALEYWTIALIWVLVFYVAPHLRT